tara:strand:- start:3158 stop:3685 length:528 start_codon:yes stop_codon:yes gene_type:complete
MNRKIVTDEFVSQLLESNSWDKAGINIEEKTMRHQQGVKKGTSKARRKAIQDTGDIGERHAKAEGARRERAVLSKERKEGTGAYAPQNDSTEVESNFCPLCEADFGENELTDEALQEHAASMMEVFSEAGLISEQVEESFIIENAEEIIGVLSEAGLLVESVDEDSDEDSDEGEN